MILFLTVVARLTDSWVWFTLAPGSGLLVAAIAVVAVAVVGAIAPVGMLLIC